jgi:hypothetical protein
MKRLVDQERAIYNEERDRLEEDIHRGKLVAEAKLRLIKNRLLTVFCNERDGEGGEMPIEEVIERVVAKFFKRSQAPKVGSESRNAGRYLLSATNRSFDETQKNPHNIQIYPYST